MKVYALNGSEYDWRNEKNEVQGTRNQRKREFNRLLAQEVLRIKANGMKVVLIGIVSLHIMV